MEKRGTKLVEITAIDDKRQITAVFGSTLSGDFLPVQLIFTGTTPAKSSFPFGLGHHLYGESLVE